MQIEVNVSEISLDTVVGHDHDGEPLILADLVARKLIDQAVNGETWDPLRGRVKEIRDEEIRALVAPAVAEAFAEPVQRTNTWGSPAGEPVTLREAVIDEAKKVLNGIARDYRGNQQTLARQLIHELVERELRAELAGAIKEEREKVVAAVRNHAAALITEAVTRGVTGR